MVVPEAMHIVRVVHDDKSPVISGFVYNTRLRVPREDTHGRFPTEEAATAVARIISGKASEFNPQVCAAREALAKAQRAQREAVERLLAELCRETVGATPQAEDRVVGKHPALGAPYTPGVVQETDA